MDGIANVARQQQSQVSLAETHTRVTEQSQHAQKTQTHKTQTHKSDTIQNIQKEIAEGSKKIDSKTDMQSLVKQLNDAMAPISTSLHFGVDSNDIFYVSVIDTKTDKVISRFPAEKALDFLPKMKEVTGMLFDSKG